MKPATTPMTVTTYDNLPLQRAQHERAEQRPKAIVADAGRSGQRWLVGLQNFSAASLGYNRELGILSRSVWREQAWAALDGDAWRGQPARPVGRRPVPVRGSRDDGGHRLGPAAA